MLLATVGLHHVWLGLTTLQRKGREHLLGAPMAPDGLFGPISSVNQRFKRLQEEKTQLSHHLLLTPSSSQRGDEVHRYNTFMRKPQCLSHLPDHVNRDTTALALPQLECALCWAKKTQHSAPADTNRPAHGESLQ